MKQTSMERLSILACVTGLILLLAVFAGFWLEVALPEWLPMAIAAIAGFELFMAVDGFRRRRSGGGLNG